jgi:D-inositol-3-phosphate glycosyltransferase
VGFVPPGEFTGEIGALESEPGPDRAPAWLTADGLFVLTGGSPARGGASLLRRLRWVLAPLRWRSAHRPEPRLELVAWRLRRWRSPARQPIVPTDEPPCGYVYLGPGEGRIPLFEGIHPIIGDQLLATNPWEVEDRGYDGLRLLGYMHDSVPTTGLTPNGRPLLRWAARCGQFVRTDQWRPPCPGACVDEPTPGARVDRLPVLVRGWAMFPSESVTRVEITADGQPVGRARIGLDRLDVAWLCGCTDAPISGWECELGASAGIPASGPLTLGGTAYGSAGGTVALPSVTVDVATQTRLVRTTAQNLPRARRSPRTGDELNVLVFTHSLTYGGAQLYLVELLQRLDKNGIRLTVVSPADGPLRERLERIGAAIHLAPAPSPWHHRVYDARIAELTSWAAPQAFDLVIANTLVVFHGLEVAARLGLPSIFAVHESLEPAAYWATHLAPRDRKVLDRLGSALASASRMVFEAAATRELFLPYADPERLVTMPYGIDLQAIDRFRSTITRDHARSALRLGREKKVVLCLGTIEPRKSQASLARAFASMARQRPEALLALVGHGNESWTRNYRAGMAQHLLRAGMLDRVLIAPLTSNPFAWHVAADVLVCASDNESLPRVILEAMAFGTLVVSTDVFGIPEVIEDGVTGFLCRSRDEHEIAETLGDVLIARPEHREIRAAAAARVRQRHDADAYAADFQDLLHEIVHERPAASSLAL